MAGRRLGMRVLCLPLRVPVGYNDRSGSFFSVGVYHGNSNRWVRMNVFPGLNHTTEQKA